jgi:hypothetical protein
MRNRNCRRTLEQRIARHIRRGEPVSLASASAESITRVLLDSVSPQRGRVPLFHLRDAHIFGALDLQQASLGIPLVFENCTFDEPVTMRGSEVKMLESAHARCLRSRDKLCGWRVTLPVPVGNGNVRARTMRYFPFGVSRHKTTIDQPKSGQPLGAVIGPSQQRISATSP